MRGGGTDYVIYVMHELKNLPKRYFFLHICIFFTTFAADYKLGVEGVCVIAARTIKT